MRSYEQRQAEKTSVNGYDVDYEMLVFGCVQVLFSMPGGHMYPQHHAAVFPYSIEILVSLETRVLFVKRLIITLLAPSASKKAERCWESYSRSTRMLTL